MSQLTAMVALCDDIEQEGVVRILEHQPDILVPWVLSTLPATLSGFRKHHPDVLIFDLGWVGDSETASRLRSTIAEHPAAVLIGMAAYHELSSNIFDGIADKILLKVATRQQLLDTIRDVCRRKRGLDDPDLTSARAALQRVTLRIPGDAWRDHEIDIAQILKYVFSPALGSQYLQARTLDGTERRDVVMVNQSEVGFFAWARIKHGVDYVVFEVKNVNETKPEHLHQTAAYCWRALGRLGFVVARTHPGETWDRHAAAQWHRHETVVLLLCDNDLQRMVEMKAFGEDPICIVRELYDRLILSL